MATINIKMTRTTMHEKRNKLKIISIAEWNELIRENVYRQFFADERNFFQRTNAHSFSKWTKWKIFEEKKSMQKLIFAPKSIDRFRINLNLIFRTGFSPSPPSPIKYSSSRNPKIELANYWKTKLIKRYNWNKPEARVDGKNKNNKNTEAHSPEKYQILKKIISLIY